MNSFDAAFGQPQETPEHKEQPPWETGPTHILMRGPQAADRTIRVLLIEDDDVDAANVTRSLRNAEVPYEIDHAITLAEAIARLQYKDYTVALVDMNLPDASGEESFEQIRAFDSRLPIVVLTGNDDENMAVDLISSGAQDYICKLHLNAKTLSRTLRFAVVRHQMALGYQAAAQRDPLTGLPNRRKLGEEFDKAMKITKQYHEPFSVSLIDLDRFKYVNDQFGHCFGDAALKQFSKLLTEHIGRTAWVGRFGGEEFAVLMPRMSIDRGSKMIQGLLEHIASNPVVVDRLSLSMTASAGITVALPEEHWDTVFTKCDSALYQAKQQGRNQLVSLVPDYV